MNCTCSKPLKYFYRRQSHDGKNKMPFYLNTVYRKVVCLQLCALKVVTVCATNHLNAGRNAILQYLVMIWLLAFIVISYVCINAQNISLNTLVNGNIKELAHRKQQKSQKVILPASHWLCVNALMNNRAWTTVQPVIVNWM